MFYISSRGSSACTWVTKVLSMHPKIVCFHASRSFPPDIAGHTFPHKKKGIREISAKQFVEGLILCTKQTQNEKFFGSIHGYYGVEAKKSCEEMGGIFSYITRDPLNRIHSAFMHGCNVFNSEFSKKINHLDVCKLLKNVDLLNLSKTAIKDKHPKSKNFLSEFLRTRVIKKMDQNLVNYFKDLKQINYIKKKRQKIKKLNENEYLSSLFIQCLDSFFYFDNNLFLNCSTEQGIKMEELVKSKDYFENVFFKKIEPSLKLNNNYLDNVFNTKKINIHRNEPLTNDQIWNTWPQSMKDAFLFFFKYYEIKKICQHFNYQTSLYL